MTCVRKAAEHSVETENNDNSSECKKIVALQKQVLSLEKLVKHQSDELHKEKIRADMLLYQTVPRTVADALKLGEKVQAEIFESATLYFSDIVGYTTICFAHKPNEFVNILNALYFVLDEIILKHKAYAVDVIGDSYLVVGGVPDRNGTRHVTQIADMALDIISTLKDKKFQHFPQIRVGIHTGKIGGGVAGVTVPRYFLFGKSLTYAACMESTSEPGKIIVSEDTANYLKPLGNYYIVKHKAVEIKGKGKYETYWLEENKAEPSMRVIDTN